jgi:hypothetical protein
MKNYPNTLHLEKEYGMSVIAKDKNAKKPEM